jgi:hypothetical protein
MPNRAPSLRSYHTSCPFVTRHSDYFPGCGFLCYLSRCHQKRGASEITVATLGLPSHKFCVPTKALQSTHPLENGSFINRKSKTASLFLVNFSLVPVFDTCGFWPPI